jgi:predicted RNA-binding protein associated with RNAse of E/G family
MQERLYNENRRGQKITNADYERAYRKAKALFGKLYNKVIPIHTRNDQEMP